MRKVFLESYKNLSGNSNVESYGIGDSFIVVKFKHGAFYKYDFKITGRDAVMMLIRLAESGNGLGAKLASKPYLPHAAKGGTLQDVLD